MTHFVPAIGKVICPCMLCLCFKPMPLVDTSYLVDWYNSSVMVVVSREVRSNSIDGIRETLLQVGP